MPVIQPKLGESSNEAAVRAGFANAKEARNAGNTFAAGEPVKPITPVSPATAPVAPVSPVATSEDAISDLDGIDEALKATELELPEKKDRDAFYQKQQEQIQKQYETRKSDIASQTTERTNLQKQKGQAILGESRAALASLGILSDDPATVGQSPAIQYVADVKTQNQRELDQILEEQNSLLRAASDAKNSGDLALAQQQYDEAGKLRDERNNLRLKAMQEVRAMREMERNNDILGIEKAREKRASEQFNRDKAMNTLDIISKSGIDDLESFSPSEIAEIERATGLPENLLLETVKFTNRQRALEGWTYRVDTNPITGEATLSGFRKNPDTLQLETEELSLGMIGDRFGPDVGEDSTLTPIEQSQAALLAKQLYGTIRTKDQIEQFLMPIVKRMESGENIDDIADSLRLAGQSVEFTGSIRDAAQQITSDLTPTRTEATFDKLDDVLSTGSVDKVKDFLKKMAVDNSPGGTEQAKMITGQERTIEFLEEIQNDLTKFESKGGETNIFTGTLEQIAKKVGTVKSTELRTIATKILKARQQYRRSMTGVAFSPGENAEYDAIFPNINKTQEFNTATLRALKESFKGDIDFFYGFAMGHDAYKKIFTEIGKQGIGGTKNIEDYRQEFPQATDEELQSLMEEESGKTSVGSDTYKATGTTPTPSNIKIGAGLAVPNNNPGNLRLAGQIGATQGKGGFARFNSPQEGFRALIGDIEAKKATGGRLNSNSTLQELVFVYAPPSENASQQYVKQVAEWLGVSPNTPIGKIDTYKLAKAIAKKESSTIIL